MGSMKRQPSRKARAMRSESSDAESTTTQIDPRPITRRKKIEYIDSPVSEPECASEWDGELEFAGSQPRR
jgi:hypothetical protein